MLQRPLGGANGSRIHRPSTSLRVVTKRPTLTCDRHTHSRGASRAPTAGRSRFIPSCVPPEFYCTNLRTASHPNYVVEDIGPRRRNGRLLVISHREHLTHGRFFTAALTVITNSLLPGDNGQLAAALAHFEAPTRVERPTMCRTGRPTGDHRGRGGIPPDACDVSRRRE